MDYHLGVDIGTTSVKAVAFSAQGEKLAQQVCSYEMIHPSSDRSEQDPDKVLAAVMEGINAICEKLSPSFPAAIAFSAALHSIMAVDEKGHPLTNCIIWADNRAVDFAAAFRETELGMAFYRASGVPIHAMSPFCKLAWLRINDPLLFQRAYKFIGIKEYIFFRLFGEFVVDTAIASATGLLNLQTLYWDEAILAFLKISAAKFSMVVNVKKVFHIQGRKLSLPGLVRLPDDLPVVIGGSDGACANLSIGKADKQAMVITIGASPAVRILADKPATDDFMRTFCYHAVDDQYIQGGAGNNGAIVLEWLKDTLLKASENMTEFLKLAEQAPAGSDGLIFLPYILGERAPLWNAYAKGVFFGLSINHTKSHLVRSAMEAVIYGVYSIGKVLMEKNTVTEIYATGGFARNALWVQIVADVFNRRVVLSGAAESSAWGAVVIEMEALKISASERQEQKIIYYPDAETHKIYGEQYKRFERLNDALKKEFVDTGF